MARLKERAEYQVGPHALFQPIDEGAIVLHEVSGDYFELDAVGMLVWRRLEAPASPAEIGDLLAEAYGIERERADADGRRFMEELLQAGLLREA